VRYLGATYEMLLIQFDAAGSVQWSETIAPGGRSIASDLLHTVDGGYVLAGATDTAGAGERDCYLVKTDDTGDVEWAQTYGGALDDTAQGVAFGIGYGYVVCGGSSSGPTAGDYDAYVVRTDDAGAAEWTWSGGGRFYDAAVSICTVDSGYVVAVDTVEDAAETTRSIRLVKLSPSGGELWSRTFGGDGADQPASVRAVSDGGFVIGGWTGSFTATPGYMYIIKTDGAGFGPSRP
jgi:hypothetical protein